MNAGAQLACCFPPFILPEFPDHRVVPTHIHNSLPSVEPPQTSSWCPEACILGDSDSSHSEGDNQARHAQCSVNCAFIHGYTPHLYNLSSTMNVCLLCVGRGLEAFIRKSTLESPYLRSTGFSRNP